MSRGQDAKKGPAMKHMTIGTAARNAGVGVETIRFYERIGLIDQPLKPAGSGFREYPETIVQVIHFIRQAQDIGFSLKEIRELLSLRIDPNADCAQVRKRAGRKLDEVKCKIENLNVIKSALEALIADCPGEGAVRHCSILETLATEKLAGIGDSRDKQHS